MHGYLSCRGLRRPFLQYSTFVLSGCSVSPTLASRFPILFRIIGAIDMHHRQT